MCSLTVGCLCGKKMDGCCDRFYVFMHEGDNKGSAKHTKSAKIKGSGQCRVAKEEVRGQTRAF